MKFSRIWFLLVIVLFFVLLMPAITAQQNGANLAGDWKVTLYQNGIRTSPTATSDMNLKPGGSVAFTWARGGWGDPGTRTGTWQFDKYLTVTVFNANDQAITFNSDYVTESHMSGSYSVQDSSEGTWTADR